LCQAWPQLCHASGGTTNRNLTLIYNDGWLSAATMLTLLEMDAKAIDGLQGASVEEVRGALRATLDEGAPLAQETARRMLAQVDAGSGQEAGQKAMLTTIEKVIFLKEVPFFQGMTIDQLRVLASISEELVCAEGQKIFAEGEYGDALYVVISGQVAIQRQTKRGSRTSITRLATLGPREYFAEMSIFDNEPYSADAVALKPVELLLVRQNTLVGLIRHQPDLALSLLKELSRRLRKANDQIAEKTQAKPKQLMDLYDKF